MDSGNRPFIVALSGKAHSGKTTIANELAEAYGWNHISLAAALKREVRERFNLSVEQTDGYFKNSPTHYRRHNGDFYTPRDIMIRWGFASREIDPDYWLKQLRFKSTYVNVISDMRFLNEAKWLKDRGAILIRLERDKNLRGFESQDASETELDDFPFDLKIPASCNVNMDDVPVIARQVYEFTVGERCV